MRQSWVAFVWHCRVSPDLIPLWGGRLLCSNDPAWWPCGGEERLSDWRRWCRLCAGSKHHSSLSVRPRPRRIAGCHRSVCRWHWCQPKRSWTKSNIWQRQNIHGYKAHIKQTMYVPHQIFVFYHPCLTKERNASSGTAQVSVESALSMLCHGNQGIKVLLLSLERIKGVLPFLLILFFLVIPAKASLPFFVKQRVEWWFQHIKMISRCSPSLWCSLLCQMTCVY